MVGQGPQSPRPFSIAEDRPVRAPQTSGPKERHAAAPLEMSANFARRLIGYMDATGSETPGEALAALAMRNGNDPR